MLIKEAKFTLDKPTSTEPTYIFLRYSCADGQLKYSIQETILPAEWDFEKQRPNSKKNKRLENELVRISNVVDQYREYCKKNNNQPVKKADLVEELQKNNIGKITTVKPKARSKILSDVLQEIIDDAKNGILLNSRNGRKYADDTVRRWSEAKRELERFNPNLTIDDINEQFYNGFLYYCNEKGFAVNHTGTHIVTLKKLMGEAVVRGYTSNLSFLNFKQVKENSFQIALNEEEIKRLINLDLSNNTTYDNIRDRYLIGIYTGLRNSDMKTLTIDNFYFHKNRIIHTNKKTGDRIEAPIHPVIHDIIDKYGGQLPKQYHVDSVIRVIREVGKMAGITDEVRYIRTIGGKKVPFVEPKYKLMATHTVRRTAATNMLRYLPAQQVMPLLGMRTLQTIFKYNKQTPEGNADIVQYSDYYLKEKPVESKN